MVPGAAAIGGQQTPDSPEQKLEMTDTPMPIMMYHGRNDNNVRIEGGPSGSSAVGRIDLPLTDAIEYWATVNGCSEEFTTTTNQDASMRDYECTNAPVRVVLIDDLGHGYPDPDVLEPGEGVDFDFASLLFSFLLENPKQ